MEFEVRNEGGLPINIVVCNEDGKVVLHVFTKPLRKEHFKQRIRIKEGEGALIQEEKDGSKLSYIQ